MTTYMLRLQVASDTHLANVADIQILPPNGPSWSSPECSLLRRQMVLGGFHAIGFSHTSYSLLLIPI